MRLAMLAAMAGIVGLAEPASALDKVLTSRHVAHEFNIYPGRHDAVYFAAHLPASLEFHSKLFEAVK